MFHDGFFMGGMWFGWIFWIAIIGLIVYLIMRQSNQKYDDKTKYTNETPIDILKKRYAGGEITREEFLKIKEDLK